MRGGEDLRGDKESLKDCFEKTHMCQSTMVESNRLHLSRYLTKVEFQGICSLMHCYSAKFLAMLLLLFYF